MNGLLLAAAAGDYLDSLIGIAGLVLGFGGLIFVHELGHYILAKWNGVRVSVFSLGMGPYLLSFTKGETVYVLSLVPIGGYVKMTGQDDMRPNLETTRDPHDYRNKRSGQKAAILAAGALFNLLFALGAFTYCYYVGVEMLAPVVGEVSPGSPLAQAEVLTANGWEPRPLREGDRIRAINGVPVKSFMEITLAVAGSGVGTDVWIDFQRNELNEHAPVRVKTARNDVLGAAGIGLDLPIAQKRYRTGFSTERRVVVAKTPDAKSPAGRAGVKMGDIIYSLDGLTIRKPEEMIARVQAGKGKEQQVVVQRGDELVPFKIQAAADDGAYRMGLSLSIAKSVSELDRNSEAYALGMREGFIVKSFRPLRDGQTLELSAGPLLGEGEESEIKMRIPAVTRCGSTIEFVQEIPLEEAVRCGSVVEALSVAWSDLLRHSFSVFTVLKGIVTRDVSPTALAGPVGIASIMTKVAVEHSFTYYIWFLAFLSVNLGMLQFVPIPLLDGWHLLMVGIEKLKGGPIAPWVQEYFQYAGLFIILSLLLFATRNDIVRIFH